MKQILVNGSIYFYGFNVGVPRYSFEILKELDKLPMLTELPKLKEFTSGEEESEAMEAQLPWSEKIPDLCRKKSR